MHKCFICTQQHSSTHCRDFSNIYGNDPLIVVPISSCFATTLKAFFISKDMELQGLKEIYTFIPLKLIDVLYEILKVSFWITRKGIKTIVSLHWSVKRDYEWYNPMTEVILWNLWGCNKAVTNGRQAKFST